MNPTSDQILPIFQKIIFDPVTSLVHYFPLDFSETCMYWVLVEVLKVSFKVDIYPRLWQMELFFNTLKVYGVLWHVLWNKHDLPSLKCLGV